MGAGVLLTVGSFIYMILLCIVYFSKKRLNSYENKIFSITMIVNLIGLFLHILLFILMLFTDINSPLNIITIVTSKIYLLYLITWITLFTQYILIISYKDKTAIKTYYEKISTVTWILVSISSIIIFILKIYFHSETGKMYTYGPAVNYVYLYSGILIFINIICLLKNIKNIIQKKYVPILVYLGLIMIVTIVQRNSPWIQLMTSLTGFVVFLMYFTIENPDVLMLNEIKKSKERSDKSSIEKTNFLFTITGEINEEIKNINNVLRTADETENKEEIKECIKESLVIVNRAKKKLNETLDISEEDVRNINLVNNRYNFYNLISQINSQAKNKIQNDVEYRTDISNNIPSYLYGDSIKLKQIITSLIDNSIKHTKEGFIELKIYEIIKYDICRLIVTVTDSGEGMTVDEINKVLNDEIEIDTETSELKLSNIRKIVNLIGGTINIESRNDEKNTGTSVTVTINQLIKEEEENKTISTYVDNITIPKILLVSDNGKKLVATSKTFSKYQTEIDTASMGEECLNKIRNKHEYNLIILKQDMDKLEGIQVFEKLKKIKNFNIPVILVINPTLNKEDYKDLGFLDVITEPLTKEKIDKIMEQINSLN